MPEKRNWIVRMVDLFNILDVGVIYNKTNIRDVLKDKCDDSISLPTTGELLEAIVQAHERGLTIRIGDKTRRIVEKKTPNSDSLYELIEE